MNWLIVLIILVVVLAVLWKFHHLLGFKNELQVLYQKGNAESLPSTVRIKTITFNMGKNSRTKDEWKQVIQKWDIITAKNYDILFVALQESWNESSQYGQMGKAISEVLSEYYCYSYFYDGPPSIMRKPFSVQNLVFVRKNLVSGKPGVLKGKVCHLKKAGLFCTKATVGLALEFADRRLVFLSSHLPFKSKSTDYGYNERAESMKEGLELLAKLESHENTPENTHKNTVIWAGDLNFRRMPQTDGSTIEQLNYLRDHGSIPGLSEFKEMQPEFPPTCKLLEQNKMMKKLEMPSNQSAIDLRRSSSNNELTTSILQGATKAYNTEPEPGQKREPSYCDRILTRHINNEKYYSWTDGQAVDSSDHNVVVLEATINNTSSKVV
jgi:endonuclease/exonuclease/phosphatase family metal-dependent hydrolase